MPNTDYDINRLCVFAHYDRDAIIDDYVIFYLKELKTVCRDIIFVSVSDVSDAEKLKLDGLVSVFINKKNEGYDFGSWKAGFEFIGYQNLHKYDEVVLANDSCYASANPMKDIFLAMRSSSCSAWSITSCRAIEYHMQSYFMVIKKEIFLSKWFEDFWNKVTNQPSKLDYILRYEVGFSRLIKQNGYKISTYVSIPRAHYCLLLFQYIYKLIWMKLFSTKYKIWQASMRTGCGVKRNNLYRLICLPKVALCSLNLSLHPGYKYTIPLIKVMLFRDNPLDMDLQRIKLLISKKNSKLPEVIDNHIRRLKSIS